MSGRRGRIARVLVPMILASAIACGAASPRVEPPSARVRVADFPTGIEALALARERVASATVVLGMRVTFARDKGRAEFWTIELADQARPSVVSKVEVSGDKVLSVAESQTQVPPGVSVDSIVFDSSDASDKASELQWLPPRTLIRLDLKAFAIGTADGPPAAVGKAYWDLALTQTSDAGPLPLGRVWVSVETLDVLFECRVSERTC